MNIFTNYLHFQQYFGEMNIGPVLDLLWSNGRRDLMNINNYTLSHFIRMPYTNNWRIPNLRITHDCSRCTVPAASGQRGIEIANRYDRKFWRSFCPVHTGQKMLQNFRSLYQYLKSIFFKKVLD